MKVSSITTYNLQLDRMQRTEQQDKHNEDYRKVVERRNFDRNIGCNIRRLDNG